MENKELINNKIGELTKEEIDLKEENRLHHIENYSLMNAELKVVMIRLSDLYNEEFKIYFREGDYDKIEKLKNIHDKAEKYLKEYFSILSYDYKEWDAYVESKKEVE